jgi:hypothetical protein
MKFKQFLTVAALAFAAANASAVCYGSAERRTCYDDAGNSYTTTKIGSVSTTSGYNARTGSNWSQQSQTYGNTTYMSGTAANGKQWNGTINSFGGTTTYSGVDSRGRLTQKTCTAYGCY